MLKRVQKHQLTVPAWQHNFHLQFTTAGISENKWASRAAVYILTPCLHPPLHLQGSNLHWCFSCIISVLTRLYAHETIYPIWISNSECPPYCYCWPLSPSNHKLLMSLLEPSYYCQLFQQDFFCPASSGVLFATLQNSLCSLWWKHHLSLILVECPWPLALQP